MLRRTALRARAQHAHVSVHRRWESGGDSASSTRPPRDPSAVAQPSAESQWRMLRRRLRHLHETEVAAPGAAAPSACAAPAALRPRACPALQAAPAAESFRADAWSFCGGARR
jgi:hypothetical protein